MNFPSIKVWLFFLPCLALGADKANLSGLRSWIGKAPGASRKNFFDQPEVKKAFVGILNEGDLQSLQKRKWASPFSYVDNVLATCSTPVNATEDIACMAFRLPEGHAAVSFSKDRYHGPIEWRTKESTVQIRRGPTLLGDAKEYVAGCRPSDCTVKSVPAYSGFPVLKQVEFLQRWVDKHPFEVDAKTKKDFFDQKEIKPQLFRLLSKRERERLTTDLESVSMNFILLDGVLSLCGNNRKKTEAACVLYDSVKSKLYVVFKSMDGASLDWRGTDSPSMPAPVPFSALIFTAPKIFCCT